MEIKTLLRANLKSHRGTAVGVFVLIALVSLSLCTVLCVAVNANRYVNSELSRLNYGDITVWVSNVSDSHNLTNEITNLSEVEAVGVQPLIFSEYEIGEQESDSEGQLITYEPQNFPYKFFSDDLSTYISPPKEILQGEVYVCASMVSMFGVQKGDTITFPIARSGVDVKFTVKGFYEDPFMGSSMIGMKGFLISENDHKKIADIIAEEGTDALAREGYMFHITQSGELTAAELSAMINEKTSVQSFVEFSHSKEAISGFMLTLQNVFTSFLLAFVAIMLLASLAVISHSIGSAIMQDYSNMGILKTLGFTSEKLRLVQLLQYALISLIAVITGLLLSLPVADFICRMTVTTTGLLVPSSLPYASCIAALFVIFLLLMGFVRLRTKSIGKISPVEAICRRKNNSKNRKAPFTVKKRGLCFSLALRQIMTGKRRYISACSVAMLLVLFASLIGRVDNWLGADGKGLMNAFNPADLHIAAQPMGETSLADVEKTIESFSEITDLYDLAMPSVSVNGLDMTANVITDPERFHMLQGKTCNAEDEIVLTEFAASDLGVQIGDSISVSGNAGSAEYKVSGIYQCANDMGMNVGLSCEGYVRIGQETPNMWCRHYFIANESLQPQIMQTLSDTYGGDVYLHENSWPGLFGILSAMKMLMIFLYAMVIIFVLVATLLTAKKLLHAEQRDLRIYRTIGFTAAKLRFSFSLRFITVALIGGISGTILSAVLTDPLVAMLMRMEGISNFSSQADFHTIVFPVAAVTILFGVFAFLASAKLTESSLTVEPDD